MAIDRGGLRYEIEVVLKNLQLLRLFRSELGKLASAQRAAGQAAREAANSTRRQATAANSAARAAQNAAAAAKASRQQAAAAQQAARAQARGARSAAQTSAQMNRQASATRRASNATRQAGDSANRAAAKFARLERALGITEGRANRLSFTFRRLFGILAAFAIARRGVDAFGELVKRSVAFSDMLDRAEISLAGILSSVGRIVDEEGKLVQGAEAYLTAKKLAREQMGYIRQDALRTVATVEELTEAFRIGLAPGLAAGLNVDQIRQITLLISQTAAAMDVPQNQLSEEIRSILSGTAADRVTRLAKAFGLSSKELNKQIREATREGRLFDFITGKLNGFSLAAEEAANSLLGLSQRLGDAIGLVGGTAAAGLFNELKASLKSLIEVLTPTSGKERIIDPKAVSVLVFLFEGMRSAVASVRAALSNVGLDKWVNIAVALGKAFEFVGDVAALFIEGASAGLSDFGRLLASATERFKAVFGDTSTLRAFAVQLLRIGTLIGAISIAISGVLFVTKLIVSPITLIVSSLYKIIKALIVTKGQILLIYGRVLILPILIAAAFMYVKKMLEKLLDLKLTFTQMFQLLRDAPAEIFAIVAHEMTKLFLNFGLVVVEAVSWVIEKILAMWKAVFEKMADWVELLPDWMGGKAMGRGLRAVAASTDAFGVAIDKWVKERQEAVADAEKKIERSQKRLAAILKKKVKPPEPGDPVTFGDWIDQQLGALTSSIDKHLNKLLGPEIVDVPGIALSIAEGVKKGYAFVKGLIGGKKAGVKAPFRIPEFEDGELISEDEMLRLREGILKETTRLEADSVNKTRARRIELEAELSVLEDRKALLDEQFRPRFEAIRKAETNAITEEDKAEVAKALAEENYKLALSYTEIDLKAQGARRELEALGDGSVLAGVKAGLVELEKSIDPFEAGFKLIQDFANGLATTLAEALSEPKEAGAKLLEFFKQLATSIIAELLRIQIIKALTGIFGGGFAAGGPVGEGKAKGGIVGLPHSRARGYADGGSIHGPRPKGLDPSDTVPIWAAAGEFVQPLAAVREYGLEVMEAIRRRAIDPVMLRGLVTRGGAALPSVRRSRGMGFAEGGEILARRDAHRRAAVDISVRSGEIVSDGLGPNILRVVSPGIKRPRNVAEAKRSN